MEKTVCSGSVSVSLELLCRGTYWSVCLVFWFIFIDISSVPAVLLANVVALFLVSLTVVYAPS